MPLDHYVPQVHLRNFYSPALGGRLYATRKSDLRSFTPNSESVCRIDEGSTNVYLEEPREIEEFLKEIEPKYNRALRTLAGDDIDPECIYTVAGFAAYVATCSPGGMRIFTEGLHEIVKSEIAVGEAHGLFPAPPEKLAGRTLVDLLRSGDLAAKVDPKYSQAINSR